MAGRQVLLQLGHFLTSILVINFLYSILPVNVTNHIFQLSYLLLCFLITQLTIGMSKKIFCSGRVKPNHKAVLITGCARGFGHAAAKHLYSKGYHVFASCLDLNSPGAKSLKSECCSRLQVFQLDTTSVESVQKAVQFVKENLCDSELWAVINNAGIHKGFLLEMTSIEDLEQSLNVNVLGPARVTKAFLPLLRQTRGRVINIASIIGRLALSMNGPYSVSKFACVGFSEYLRYELDLWNVQVISIEPEIFKTDMTSGETIEESVDTMFENADEDIKKEYGENFLKAFKNLAMKIAPPSSNVQKVLDAIEAAVSLKHPDAVYQVYRNFGVRICGDIWGVLPSEFRLIILRIVLYFFGIHKFGNVNKRE